MDLAIGTGPERREAAPASARVSERSILRLGIGLTGLFLLASVVSGLLPVGAMHGWVATHLSLAGAATVAIGTFMPHFGVTLAGTRPEAWWLRVVGVVALATGMATVAVGRPLAGAEVAGWGGLLVLAGIGVTAWTTYAPMRSGLARRHPIVQVTYGVALADLALGASLAVLFLFGWTPITAVWVALKPAHAWLNVFGFVSLTVAGTLVYLYPTITGARIRPQPAMAVAVVGLLAGAPLSAAGYAAGMQPVAMAGAGLVTAAAAGLLAYGIDTWRRRGAWARDRAWHDLSARHGLLAMAWFTVTAAAALGSIALDGVVVPGWTLGVLAVPLIGGWVGQVLVAAWTYLLPAVGPGSMEAKARQRDILAVAGTWRVVAWNTGLLLLWPGVATLSWWLIAPGAALFGSAAVASLVVLARGLVVGLRGG
jgi:nitrite reductase (NO-forming)